MWRYFMILNLKIESGILVLRRFRGDVFGSAAMIEEKVADFEKKGTWISYIFDCPFHASVFNDRHSISGLLKTGYVGFLDAYELSQDPQVTISC